MEPFERDSTVPSSIVRSLISYPSFDRYTPSENQWSLIHPMHMNRSDANGASLDGKVYIVGGFNGTECMNSAEYYDPLVNQ